MWEPIWVNSLLLSVIICFINKITYIVFDIRKGHDLNRAPFYVMLNKPDFQRV